MVDMLFGIVAITGFLLMVGMVADHLPQKLQERLMRLFERR